MVSHPETSIYPQILPGPKSDQHQFSPNNISRLLRVKVMRITKLITKGLIHVFKSLVRSAGNYCKSSQGHGKL